MEPRQRHTAASLTAWPSRWNGAVLMQERRRQRRVSVDRDVRLLIAGQETPARLRNLCRDGMLVETSITPQRDTPVWLRLDAPDRHYDGQLLLTRVRHCTSGAVGLEIEAGQPLAEQWFRALL